MYKRQVYGVDGEELPQIEEQPVAFAMYILSPNNCVINFAYGVCLLYTSQLPHTAVPE